MRILAGWLLGVATAWAALAIWRTVPPFPDLDYERVPEPDPWAPTVVSTSGRYIDDVIHGQSREYCHVEGCAWRHSLAHVDHEVGFLYFGDRR